MWRRRTGRRSPSTSGPASSGTRSTWAITPPEPRPVPTTGARGSLLRPHLDIRTTVAVTADLISRSEPNVGPNGQGRPFASAGGGDLLVRRPLGGSGRREGGQHRLQRLLVRA